VDTISPVGCLRRCGVFFSLFLMLALGFADGAQGEVNVDIRAAGTLSSENRIGYVLTIDDCSNVTSVSISNGATTQKISASELTHVEGSTSAYDAAFSLEGDGRYTPVWFKNSSKAIAAKRWQIHKKRR